MHTLSDYLQSSCVRWFTAFVVLCQFAIVYSPRLGHQRTSAPAAALLLLRTRAFLLYCLLPASVALTAAAKVSAACVDGKQTVHGIGRCRFSADKDKCKAREACLHES